MGRLYDSPDELIWRVCPYLRDLRDCNRCPASEIYRGEPYQRACRSISQEVINIAQTGDPWRKPVSQQARNAIANAQHKESNRGGEA